MKNTIKKKILMLIPVTVLVNSAAAQHYVDWTDMQVHNTLSIDNPFPQTGAITYDPNSTGYANGVITDGVISAQISTTGCYENWNSLASGPVSSVLDGSSTTFANAASFDSPVDFTDKLATDMGVDPSTHLSFAVARAEMINPTFHLARVSSGTRWTFSSSANIENIVLKGGAVGSWVIRDGNTVAFGGVGEGTIQLIGAFQDLKIASSREDRIEFQIGAESLKAVPEPSSAALLGLGALGLLMRRKR